MPCFDPRPVPGFRECRLAIWCIIFPTGGTACRDKVPLPAVQRSLATYGYDQLDRLTSFSKGSTSAGHAYNGDGLRQSKTVGGTTTQGTWDTAEGLPLLIEGGTTTEIDGPDGLPLEQITGSGMVSYYVHDQLGSTMALLGPGGRIATTYDYDAYGTPQTSGIYPTRPQPNRQVAVDATWSALQFKKVR